jgi:thioredoxin 2
MPLIQACPSCGTKNRLAGSHLAEVGHCGSCKAELGPLSTPVDADPELFDELTAAASVPVLVDFWAEWCGPCKAAAPHVTQTAEQMAGRALVLKVDVDQHPELPRRFQVPGFPTFLVLKGGVEVKRHLGFATAPQMLGWLEEAQ